jgi:hypothetical protein
MGALALLLVIAVLELITHVCLGDVLLHVIRLLVGSG